MIINDNAFLHRIARHLILNAGYCKDLGLFHGKMGIILFFAHYARYAQNKIYNDFADQLLKEIYAEIHTETPINLKNGLCGIGWGIEYLLQMKFLEGDSNKILADLDAKIMERDPLRMKDESFETGAYGILYYIMVRLTSPNRKKENVPFDNIYLNCWKELIENKANGNSNPNAYDSLFLRWANGEEVSINMDKFLVNLIAGNALFDDEFIYLPYGIQNGCAGIGLKNILLLC